MADGKHTMTKALSMIRNGIRVTSTTDHNTKLKNNTAEMRNGNTKLYTFNHGKSNIFRNIYVKNYKIQRPDSTPRKGFIYIINKR